MLDDARVDVKIVVANNNVSSPNTTIYTCFEFKVGFWENTSFSLTHLLIVSLTTASRPPNCDLRLLEHELGRNSNFIVHED